MTIKEIKEREKRRNELIKNAENLLDVKFDYYDKITNTYDFIYGGHLKYNHFKLTENNLEKLWNLEKKNT